MNATSEEDELRLGESDGLLGVSIVAPRDKTAVRVTVSCDAFVEVSTFAGTLATSGETYQVYPKVKYRFDQLSKCRQATPATLTIQVQLDDNDVQEFSSTVTFRSINDCPFAISAGDRIEDISFAFASYVNEQHPYVDKLLREALDIGVVEGFIGYQSKSDDDVLQQVYAVWDLFVARDMRYSSITSTAAESSMVGSQHVRLLEETINNQQANCVDGSVLMVSILRKIGIDASLVIVPGHCYVAFYLDEKHTTQLGIETTLAGATLDLPEEVPEALERCILEESRGDKSWPSFVAAITTASSSLIEHAEQFGDAQNTQYQLIDIANARRMGVLPIPFVGNEKFVAFDHSAYSESADASDSDSDSQEEEEEE